MPTGLEQFSLTGHITLVTGATRGLGLEIARGMAGAGAVVGVNGRDPERAREIAKSIPNAFAAPFDITDLDAAGVVIDDIVARYGGLDSPSNASAAPTSWSAPPSSWPPTPPPTSRARS